MAERLVYPEVLLMAGAIGYLLLPLFLRFRRARRRTPPVWPLWVAAAGFAVYAADFDVMRRTMGEHGHHALLSILALQLAGAVLLLAAFCGFIRSGRAHREGR